MHRGDRRRILRERPRWEMVAVVSAPLASVWNVIEDLSLIPEYHPDVHQVQFLTGQARRARDVRYKCFTPGKSGAWFVEEVVEHEPFEHTVVALVNDSRGGAGKIDHFLTQISVEPRGNGETLLRLRGWYRYRGWLGRMAGSWLSGRRMRARASRTIDGLKRLSERRSRVGPG